MIVNENRFFNSTGELISDVTTLSPYLWYLENFFHSSHYPKSSKENQSAEKRIIARAKQHRISLDEYKAQGARRAALLNNSWVFHALNMSAKVAMFGWKRSCVQSEANGSSGSNSKEALLTRCVH
jgi:hypothetical protein